MSEFISASSNIAFIFVTLLISQLLKSKSQFIVASLNISVISVTALVSQSLRSRFNKVFIQKNINLEFGFNSILSASV